MKWKPLLISLLTIALLWLSFLSPLTRPLWDQIDDAAFRWLNSVLLSSKPLQYFWAALNHKLMDLAEDLIFLLFFVLGIQRAPPAMRWRRAAQFIACVALAGIFIFSINRHLLRAYPLLPRKSPSLVITPCIRISQQIRWKHVKDETAESFPGDHATTLLLFGLFYTPFVERRVAVSAWFYVGLRMLPRLILGAHWVSDIGVGSLSLALFFASCFLYTPFGTICTHSIEEILHIGRRRLDRAIKEKNV